MGVFGLCKGDPLVETLRDTFDANIVRVPEQRVQPMVALAARDGKADYRGDLGVILEGGAPEALGDVDIATSRVADVSGKRSRSVDIGLGLEILGGFLAGFGIPAAGIDASFSGAKEVAFTFGEVERRYVDPTVLGHALAGAEVSRGNPASAIYFGDDAWDLVVPDSVIGSSEFTISVERASQQDFELDVPAIQKLVGEAKAEVNVSSSSSTQVSFNGQEQLTFAFSALRLFLDADGRITQMPPQGDLYMVDEEAPRAGDAYRWKLDEPAMLELENAPYADTAGHRG